MNYIFLDFEKPLYEIRKQIKKLIIFKEKKIQSKINIDKKIKKLQKKNIMLTKKIFSNLDDWQITQLSRHPMRPHTLDYIQRIFTHFYELSGDRKYSDDKSIIGGLARINKKPIMIIGNQKGRTIEEKIKRNFGMPNPGGYRKALRLMKFAEKFNLPIIIFIDTPGAYPGIEAEEKCQAGTIANNLIKMSQISVPIICNIIGEGGSGGALAIGIGDKINMLKYSIYSVISPEGCASILWKDANKASLAAKAMKITSSHLKSFNLIDAIIEEPLGGAHVNYEKTSNNLKNHILKDLKFLQKLTTDELKNKRYKKIMKYGY